ATRGGHMSRVGVRPGRAVPTRPGPRGVRVASAHPVHARRSPGQSARRMRGALPRCIVLIRSHELLQEGWRQRTFGPAGSLLDGMVKVAGVKFDQTYHPVHVRRRIGGGDDPPSASGFNYGAAGLADTYAVRVDAAGDDSIERLR